MKIIKIIEKNKSNLKVYLIMFPEPKEIEVQLDKDKEPEIISFDKFLLMTEKELKEKEIEISSLQFLKMLEGTDIPVMIEIEKFTFGDFKISREKREEMAYEVLEMPDEEQLANIVLDENIIKRMEILLKSWTDTDLEFKNKKEMELQDYIKYRNEKYPGIKLLEYEDTCPDCKTKLDLIEKISTNPQVPTHRIALCAKCNQYYDCIMPGV